MNIERFFNEQSSMEIEELIQSIIEEKIDALISEYYDQYKVNTTTSHVEGMTVS